LLQYKDSEKNENYIEFGAANAFNPNNVHRPNHPTNRKGTQPNPFHP
jgi:hypothetical protein